VLKSEDLIKYWKNRASTFGDKAVLDVRYSVEEINKVTTRQKEIIFPVLQKYLTGREKFVLDFGCGTGRFTKALRELVQGESVGFDPVPAFIETARKNDPEGKYDVLNGKEIPIAKRSVDVFWCCLVLGGLQNRSLNKLEREIRRVLKPGGILVVIENTSKLESKSYWFYRSQEFYIGLFKKFNLKLETQYTDFDEAISVMVGKY